MFRRPDRQSKHVKPKRTRPRSSPCVSQISVPSFCRLEPFDEMETTHRHFPPTYFHAWSTRGQLRAAGPTHCPHTQTSTWACDKGRAGGRSTTATPTLNLTTSCQQAHDWEGQYLRVGNKHASKLVQHAKLCGPTGLPGGDVRTWGKMGCGHVRSPSVPEGVGFHNTTRTRAHTQRHALC